MESQNRKKREKKLPHWEGVDIEIPSSLALEQCSSSLAARHKAEYVSEIFKGHGFSVCDITGGLGVDSCSFASVAEKVHYFERNAELAAAAERNAGKLGIGNISFHSCEVDENTALPHCDLIFADPARRDNAGKKVFKLEDCSPDILSLLPKLRDLADHLLFKLSPIADLNILARGFGKDLKEIIIVSIDGEVKELLCHLEHDWDGGYGITVVELSGSETSFRFSPEEESEAGIVLTEEGLVGSASQGGEAQPECYLLEPSAAMLKSGAFKLPCSRFGLRKLDISTHLYTSKSLEGIPQGLFKVFRIKEALPFGKASFKEIRTRCPKAEVSARNLPIRSEELRTRLGVKSGSATHIFGCKTAHDGQILIICEVL